MKKIYSAKISGTTFFPDVSAETNLKLVAKIIFLLGILLIIAAESFSQMTCQAFVASPTCSNTCEGDVVFSAGGGTPPYFINISSGPLATFTSTYVFGFACPGTLFYTITDVLGNSCPIGNVLVPSVPAPVASITVSGPTSICTPNTVTLTATFNLNYTYRWRRNGVVIADNAPNTYIATISGSYDCQVISFSCATITNTIAIVVDGSPPVATITANGSTAICPSASVQLNASTGAGLTYQWRQNGINISGATLSTHTVSAGGSYDCIVTNACGSSTSNIITVVLVATPSALITAAGPATFCFPGSVTLNANTGSGLSYQWRLNGGNIAGATSSSYVANSSGNYDCIVSNNCSSSTSNIITVTLNFISTAPGSITGQTGGVCGTSLSYSISPVPNATTYNWSVPSGATITSGQATTTINVSFTSTFTSGTISVTASNSCGTSGAASIAVTGVPAQPGPITGPTSVCKNQNNVIYTIDPVPGATSYTWTKPAGAIFNSGQGTTSINIRFGKKPGNVTVRANRSCGSGPIRSLAIAMPCRMGEELSEEDLDVTLYPNPATDKLNVICYMLYGNESLKILNAVGETVLKSEILNQESAINIGALPAGIYFAEIISGNQKKVLKFIKQE